MESQNHREMLEECTNTRMRHVKRRMMCQLGNSAEGGRVRSFGKAAADPIVSRSRASLKQAPQSTLTPADPCYLFIFAILYFCCGATDPESVPASRHPSGRKHGMVAAGASEQQKQHELEEESGHGSSRGGDGEKEREKGRERERERRKG